MLNLATKRHTEIKPHANFDKRVLIPTTTTNVLTKWSILFQLDADLSLLLFFFRKNQISLSTSTERIGQKYYEYEIAWRMKKSLSVKMWKEKQCSNNNENTDKEEKKTANRRQSSFLFYTIFLSWIYISAMKIKIGCVICLLHCTLNIYSSVSTHRELEMRARIQIELRQEKLYIWKRPREQNHEYYLLVEIVLCVVRGTTNGMAAQQKNKSIFFKILFIIH